MFYKKFHRDSPSPLLYIKKSAITQSTHILRLDFVVSSLTYENGKFTKFCQCGAHNSDLAGVNTTVYTKTDAKKFTTKVIRTDPPAFCSIKINIVSFELNKKNRICPYYVSRNITKRSSEWLQNRRNENRKFNFCPSNQ